MLVQVKFLCEAGADTNARGRRLSDLTPLETAKEKIRQVGSKTEKAKYRKIIAYLAHRKIKQEKVLSG